MSKPSRRTIYGLIRLHYSKPNVSFTKPTSPIFPFLSSRTGSGSITRRYANGCSKFTPSNPRMISNTPISTPFNLGLSQLVSRSEPSSLFLFRRLFSSLKGSATGLGKGVDGNLARKVLQKPVTAVSSAFSKYREAVGLQMDAFLKRNYLFLLGVGGVLVCALLWRIMFGIASTFVSLSEGMAKYGFLALSAAMVAFAGLYIRARSTISPDKVYRMAMTKLNTSAGILEVMGAPLIGTDIRAYVMSGGRLTLKKFKPSLRSKRCFLIFPIQGSERKGLVSVEVKKKRGQYDMKLLAVDIPMTSGPDQRLYLIGDEDEYKVGGGLISELRDPVVKAMAAIKEFDDIDQVEEEEDAERERLEAEQKERKEHKENQELEKGSS